MHVQFGRWAFPTDQGATAATVMLSSKYAKFLLTQDTMGGLFVGHPLGLRILVYGWGVELETVRDIFLASICIVSYSGINNNIAQILHGMRVVYFYDFIWNLVLRYIMDAAMRNIRVSVYFLHLNWIWIFLKDELGIWILVGWSMKRLSSILIILWASHILISRWSSRNHWVVKTYCSKLRLCFSNACFSNLLNLIFTLLHIIVWYLVRVDNLILIRTLTARLIHSQVTREIVHDLILSTWSTACASSTSLNPVWGNCSILACI